MSQENGEVDPVEEEARQVEPEESSESTEPNQPSEIAQRLSRLKDSTLTVVRARERLPQPLFWSVFHAQVKEIKRAREKKRAAYRVLYGADFL